MSENHDGPIIPAQPEPSTGPQPASGRLPRGRRLGLFGGGLATVAAVAVVLAATNAGPFADTASTSGRAVEGPVTSLGGTALVSLKTFDSCPDLLAYYREHALKEVGPYGLGAGGRVSADGVPQFERSAESSVGGAPAAAPGAPAAAGQAAKPAATVNGTNVQVDGVDEADLSKRVGDLILTVRPARGPGGELRVLRTTGADARSRAAAIGRLGLAGWSPSTLLVDGSTALLIGDAPASPAVKRGPDRLIWPPMPVWQPRTRLAQVDLSDPTAPRLVRTLTVDGSLTGARAVDGVARVAITGNPHDLRFVPPQYPKLGPPLREDDPALKKLEDAARAANRKVVSASKIENWLPSYTLETPGSKVATGTLVDCASVAAPDRFAGIDTLSLVTIDLRGAGLRSWQSAGVVASGATMYATAQRTYLATEQWRPVTATGGPVDAAPGRPEVPAQTTQIHAFDSAGRSAPRYLGSGQVPGRLLNQFALDEYRGDLRVASTTDPASGMPIPTDPWPMPPGAASSIEGSDGSVSSSASSSSSSSGAVPASSSRVTVLRLQGSRLEQVGTVGDLGKGERIYSVRFIGPVGYVVTFRQVDPLYTVDLADPARPRVVGELKIPGYSAYLHPVRDGLLLGVGQDADAASGRTRGLQLSLFDVSDPAEPRLVSQVKLPAAWSDAENDHHAFTFADGLALLPYTRSWYVDPATGNGEDGESAPAGIPPGVPSLDSGVVAVRLDGTSLGAPKILRAGTDGPIALDGAEDPGVTPLRTYVDNGAIWTLTTGGLGVHDVAGLDRVQYLRFE